MNSSATGRPPDKEMQALGADLAEGVRLGTRGRLIGRMETMPAKVVIKVN